MKNEIKYVGKCPACARGIEAGDDVVERGGVAYHDGCEPPVEEVVEPPVQEIVVPSQPESLVKSTPTKSDEVLEKLLALVGNLTQEVAALKARPAQAVSLVASPKKSKAEKGAPREDVYYVINGFPTEKFPPQCLKVFRAIAQACGENHRMNEVEVWNALMDGAHPSEKASKSVGSWNYRQTPFYIFKYYRGVMVSAEYIAGPFDVV